VQHPRISRPLGAEHAGQLSHAGRRARPPPDVGEHTEQVLASWLGLAAMSCTVSKPRRHRQATGEGLRYHQRCWANLTHAGAASGHPHPHLAAVGPRAA
jgi:hypothetical protein